MVIWSIYGQYKVNFVNIWSVGGLAVQGSPIMLCVSMTYVRRWDCEHSGAQARICKAVHTVGFSSRALPLWHTYRLPMRWPMQCSLIMQRFVRFWEIGVGSSQDSGRWSQDTTDRKNYSTGDLRGWNLKEEGRKENKFSGHHRQEKIFPKNRRRIISTLSIGWRPESGVMQVLGSLKSRTAIP